MLLLETTVGASLEAIGLCLLATIQESFVVPAGNNTKYSAVEMCLNGNNIAWDFVDRNSSAANVNIGLF